MSNILNHKVLVLNNSWLPISFCSVKTALEDMNSSRSPKLALKIEYALDGKGGFDFSSPSEILPLKWEEWATIGPREHDEDCIHTPNLTVRVPTVLICKSYNKLPIKKLRPIKSVLFNMQKGKCAYSGDPMSFKEATFDHITPRSRGGKNTFENLVMCTKEINFKKADRTPEEAGLKLLVRHKEPAPITATVRLIKEAVTSPDWNIFLFK